MSSPHTPQPPEVREHPEAPEHPEASDGTRSERSQLPGIVLWSLMQRGAALLLLLLVSPVLFAAYLGVKLSSPGPFLFAQQRTGYRDRPFTVFKVRTMTVGTEKQTSLGVQRENPAIFPVGKLLRDLKIDELPQLWNIVRGDMLLVGPRPIPVALDQKLRTQIPGFAQRYAVRPGLTNVAQVCIEDNLLNEQLAGDWSRRLDADLHYIQRRNLGYDLIVLGLTALFLFRRLTHTAAGRSVATNPAVAARSIAATQVAGISVANAGYEQVIAHLRAWKDQPVGRMVGVCPVHSLMASYFNPKHRAALLASDLNTADGMPVVWAQKMLGFAQASRVYGPTLMLKTLAVAEREGWRIAFFGGHSGRLKQMLDRFQTRFPQLKVVEAISPPFGTLSGEQNDAYLSQLNASQPDIVFVGLGSPKQEIWMHTHRQRIPSVLMGVGAAFDFHAGAVRQAPAVLQKLGLEWAFRLSQEPRRLFKRYAVANPLFIAVFAKQLFERCVLLRWHRFQVVVSTDPQTVVNAGGGPMSLLPPPPEEQNLAAPRSNQNREKRQAA